MTHQYYDYKRWRRFIMPNLLEDQMRPDQSFVEFHQAWVQFSPKLNFLEPDSAAWCSAHCQHSARFPGRRHWPPFSQIHTLSAEFWLPQHLCQPSTPQSEAQRHHHWLRSGWCKMPATSLLGFWGRNPSQCGRAAHGTHQFSDATNSACIEQVSPAAPIDFSPSIQS